jgi:AcrR family transcriptional regulator
MPVPGLAPGISPAIFDELRGIRSAHDDSKRGRTHAINLGMSWDPHRRGYHHGNLREALTKAALDLIAAKGPSGFSFAEAARAAGVSPAAPYRHFRDRDALMAEIATRGFELFADELTAAWDEGRPEPYRAFVRLGRAYLGFARAEPAYYAAMFEGALPREAYPALDTAGQRAFDVLREASESLCSLLPKEKRPPSLMMSLHIWSMAHGVASLFARADASRRPIPMSAEDLLEAEVHLYLRGIGLFEVSR